MCSPGTSALLRDSHALISQLLWNLKKSCMENNVRLWFLCGLSQPIKKNIIFTGMGKKAGKEPLSHFILYPTSIFILHFHPFFRARGHAHVSLNSSSSIAMKVCTYSALLLLEI